MSDEKLRHTKGPWKRIDPGVGVACYLQGADDVDVVDEMISRGDDQIVIALAPTAPHLCEDQECPGDINRRRLELFERMAEVEPLDWVGFREHTKFPVCRFCKQDIRYYNWTTHKDIPAPEGKRHAPDCPWFLAQSLQSKIEV